jgi:hypothetical protein
MSAEPTSAAKNISVPIASDRTPPREIVVHRAMLVGSGAQQDLFA